MTAKNTNIFTTEKGIKGKNIKGDNIYIDKQIQINVHSGSLLQELGFVNFGFFNLDFFKWMSTLKLSQRDYRIFFYLLSKMQKSNECIITNDEIMISLKIAKSHLSTSIKKLLELKIIVRKKIGVGEYKIELNNIKINESLAFCGKATKENVNNHRYLAAKNCPYETQKDLWGGYTLVDKKTGKKTPSNQFLDAPNNERKERFYKDNFLLENKE